MSQDPGLSTQIFHSEIDIISIQETQSNKKWNTEDRDRKAIEKTTRTAFFEHDVNLSHQTKDSGPTVDKDTGKRNERRENLQKKIEESQKDPGQKEE